ncbi:MAG: GAF domain-containing protein [bacterium]
MAELLCDFPFRCTLSLKPLVDFWLSPLSHGASSNSCLVAGLRDQLASVPELLEPIEDLSVLERHKPIVEALMGAVFPAAFWETKPMAALVPFCMKPVVASPPFRKLFIKDDGSFAAEFLVGQEGFFRGRLARAYLRILRTFYQVEETLDFPVVCRIQDPDTGLDRYYSLQLDPRFTEIRPVGELPVLSPEQKAALLENLTNPEILTKILPLDKFQIQGLTVAEAVDVTQSEVLSALERDLIDQESVFSRAGFLRLQERLRSLFRRPDLVVGLAALNEDQVFLLNLGCESQGDGIIFAGGEVIPQAEFRGSLYEKAVLEQKILCIPDLARERMRTTVEEVILRSGGRSLLIAPLSYRGTVIGTMDLATPRPGDLGQVEALLLEQILPLFSMAVKRGLDEIEHRVQGVIKEKCTAVHPSVEWRFRRAALRYLQSRRGGQEGEMEPIVFRDVYPLYGNSDIRGSSEERNKAVQADLAEHLELALKILEKSSCSRPQPILQELSFRLRRALERLNSALASGDEISMAASVRKEVEPLFPYLSELGSDVAAAIEEYRRAVDPHLGSVYRRRKEFEESVSALTGLLSSYLDLEEAEAQAMLPHYFEKHRTDGVDYIMYVGQSLLEKGSFTDLHLENFRLWQLMLSCAMAWLGESLKPSLRVPLETTHLILLHRMPMSIRFRFDEKRFDVDGTYDIRHEILRARIDKALVRPTGERLTQPGKIALVYAYAEEAREARRHIDFLHARGFLKSQVENLELEDLPGVQGLRALRVEVDLSSSALREHVEKRLS